MSNLTQFELNQRRLARQLKCFRAVTLIRDKLGGAIGPIEERLEHVRVATLGAVADSYACMHALRVKGIITEREEQEFLDWGYDALLARIEAGQGAKIFEEGGHG